MDALECIGCGARWQGSTVRIVMALHGACPVCGGGVRVVYGAGESATPEDQGEWLLDVASTRMSDVELIDEQTLLGGSVAATIAEARHARGVSRRRRSELRARRDELRRRREVLAATLERVRHRDDLSTAQRSAVEASLALLEEADRVLGEPARAG